MGSMLSAGEWSVLVLCGAVLAIMFWRTAPKKRLEYAATAIIVAIVWVLLTTFGVIVDLVVDAFRSGP